jgi:hypothetical protein
MDTEVNRRTFNGYKFHAQAVDQNTLSEAADTVTERRYRFISKSSRDSSGPLWHHQHDWFW